jgi:hypothetical protein
MLADVEYDNYNDDKCKNQKVYSDKFTYYI